MVQFDSARKRASQINQTLTLFSAMRFYQVMLEGRNFLIDCDGKSTLLGFLTTRWVKADTPESAELAAVDLIKKDPKMRRITQNVNGEEPEPKIYLSEVYKVGWLTYIRRKPGAGYTFYDMEKASE